MTSSMAMPIKPATCDPLIVRLSETLNRLDPERLVQLYDLADQNEVTFEELAIENGLACERSIAQAYAKHYLMPLFDPPLDGPPPIDMSICKILPARLCLDNLLAPLSDDGSTIEVAIFSPDSLLLADEIRSVTGRQMRPLFTTLSVMRRLLSEMYADQNHVRRPLTRIALATVCTNSGWLCGPMGSMNLSPESANYFNELFDYALTSRATDIHFEPAVVGHRVRLRIDQRLEEHARPSATWSHEIIEQLCELAQLRSSDPRLPQEGMFQLQNATRRIDVRINTCQTTVGQKTTLRLIDPNVVPKDLASLGMESSARSELVKSLVGGEGLIVVAGLPASGKSTTLAACLDELRSDHTNICTVEQNIDALYDGANQTLIRPELGLTYGAAINSVVRQDPDVILVGEIDDRETAEACFRAAGRGCLVLASMVESDAVGCFVRFGEFGIKSAAIARTVRAIVSQRMVSRLCNECKSPQRIEAEVAHRFAIDPEQTLFRPVGCEQCRNTGYRGKFPIFEVVRLTRNVTDMIQKRETSSSIRRAVMSGGVKLMRQSAIEYAIAGDTSMKAALGLVGGR